MLLRIGHTHDICFFSRSGCSGFLLNMLLGRPEEPFFKLGTDGIWLWAHRDVDDEHAPIMAYLDCGQLSRPIGPHLEMALDDLCYPLLDGLFSLRDTVYININTYYAIDHISMIHHSSQ